MANRNTNDPAADPVLAAMSKIGNALPSTDGASAAAVIRPGAEAGALSRLGALRARMAEADPAFGAAARVERQAEALCDKVRAGLKAQRLASGLSQQELARRIDVSQSAISKIESGRGDLSLKTVFRVAEALRCTPTIGFAPAAEPLADKAAAAAETALFAEVWTQSKGDVLREQVARALVNKGETLASLGRPEEAIAAYDEVLQAFGGGFRAMTGASSPTENAPALKRAARLAED